MAFPTQPVLDNFNAGASQNLTSRAGWSSGAFLLGYTTLQTDSTPTKAVGTVALNANSYANVTAANAEVWVTMAAALTANQVDIWARATVVGASITSYALEVQGATNGWEIDKYTGGLGTGVAIASGVTQALAAGDSLGFEVIGTTLTGYYKAAAGSWVQKISVVDASIGGAGLIGISSTNTTAQITDFGGGALAADAAPASARPFASWSIRASG